MLSLHNYAQSIKGKVEESEGKPMAFANVLLLNSRDSTLVKGAVSDEKGAYIIENVRPGTYLLLVTMVGYYKAYAPAFTIKEGQADINVALLTCLTRQSNSKR